MYTVSPSTKRLGSAGRLLGEWPPVKCASKARARDRTCLTVLRRVGPRVLQLFVVLPRLAVVMRDLARNHKARAQAAARER